MPALPDSRQIKGVKGKKQSGSVISPQAESSAESTPFTNGMTSQLAQAISRDTTSAASPVMKPISLRTCGRM